MIDQIHCSDYEKLLAQIPAESVALVLTDPPYGIEYQNNFTSAPHEVLDGDYEGFSYSRLAAESYRILRPDSVIFAFTGWSTYPQHFVEFTEAGFRMKEPLICQKRPSGKTDLYGTFQSNADWLLFGHKGRFRFRPTRLLRNKRAGTIPNKGRKPVAEFKTRFPSCWFGDEYPWSSENPAIQKAFRHPTIKGQQFVEWLIQMTTDEGDVVVDPFVGSGTVAVACKRLNRRFIAGDLRPTFCEITETRLAAWPNT